MTFTWNETVVPISLPFFISDLILMLQIYENKDNLTNPYTHLKRENAWWPLGFVPSSTLATSSLFFYIHCQWGTDKALAIYKAGQKTQTIPCFSKVSTFIHPFIRSQNPVIEGAQGHLRLFLNPVSSKRLVTVGEVRNGEEGGRALNDSPLMDDGVGSATGPAPL